MVPEAVPKGAKRLELNPAFQTLHTGPPHGEGALQGRPPSEAPASSPERAWGAFHTSWRVPRALSGSTWGLPVRTGERSQKTSGSCSWRVWGLKQEVPEWTLGVAAADGEKRRLGFPSRTVSSQKVGEVSRSRVLRAQAGCRWHGAPRAFWAGPTEHKGRGGRLGVGTPARRPTGPGEAARDQPGPHTPGTPGSRKAQLGARTWTWWKPGLAPRSRTRAQLHQRGAWCREPLRSAGGRPAVPSPARCDSPDAGGSQAMSARRPPLPQKEMPNLQAPAGGCF